MTEDACSTGVALDTKYFGECRSVNGTFVDVDVDENELVYQWADYHDMENGVMMRTQMNPQSRHL